MDRGAPVRVYSNKSRNNPSNDNHIQVNKTSNVTYTRQEVVGATPKENVVQASSANANNKQSYRSNPIITHDEAVQEMFPKKSSYEIIADNARIASSSTDPVTQQQGIFSVTGKPNYIRRKRRSSPFHKSSDVELRQMPKAGPAHTEPVPVKNLNGLEGFSHTVNLRNIKDYHQENLVDDAYYQGFASALSETFEEIVNECPQFKKRTKSTLLQKLQFYVEKQADHITEPGESSSDLTLTTECPRSISFPAVPQGSQPGPNSSLDPRFHGQMRLDVSSSSTTSTVRQQQYSSWKFVRPQVTAVAGRSSGSGSAAQRAHCMPSGPGNRLVPHFKKETTLPLPRRTHQEEFIPPSVHQRQPTYAALPHTHQPSEHSRIAYPPHQERGQLSHLHPASASSCPHCYPGTCPSNSQWNNNSVECPWMGRTSAAVAAGSLYPDPRNQHMVDPYHPNKPSQVIHPVPFQYQYTTAPHWRIAPSEPPQHPPDYSYQPRNFPTASGFYQTFHPPR